MSTEEKTIDVKDREYENSNATEERERSPFSENEDEELDEFGRVKRRRQKFKSERSEEPDYNESDSDGERRESRHYHRRHRRRSSSGSRSPRRSYRRRYSDSDSDYERRRGSSSRHYRSSSHRHHSDRGYSRHNSNSSRRGDVYTEAAQYIDTEFYSTKIYIGDLENVTEDHVRSIFSRFGPLESVKLVEGKDYGFVTYEKQESALAAIQNMHGALLGSRHIKVNRAKIPERNKIGFGNIPWQDEDGLMAKEALSNRRRSSVLMMLDNVKPDPQLSADSLIPRRALTSYDDL
ncbi:MAG: hypothetical protein EXX96DRAFT_514506 [Benjaminiella poitrasii]|nr:MAG: hypothetical protein EXX96DRAFT_514506 [Benjaminiella poitrasii]